METGLFEIEAGRLSHHPGAPQLLPGSQEVIREAGSEGGSVNHAQRNAMDQPAALTVELPKRILKPSSSPSAFCGLLICPILPLIA